MTYVDEKTLDGVRREIEEARRLRARRLAEIFREVAQTGADTATTNLGSFLTVLATVTEERPEDFVRALAAIRKHADPMNGIGIGDLIKKLEAEAE
jgi:hypothetical protein